MKRHVMRKSLVVLATAALVAVLPATPGLAKGKGGPPKGVVAAVTGGGTTTLTNSSPAPFSSAPFSASDRLHISLTARQFGHGRACSSQRPCGQFLITDKAKKGSLVLKLKGFVTCTSFSGKTANVTGMVRGGFTTPRTTTVKGQAVAISIKDNAGTNGVDLVGLGASFLAGGTTPSTSSCPGVSTNLSMTHGDFVVHS